MKLETMLIYGALGYLGYRYLKNQQASSTTAASTVTPMMAPNPAQAAAAAAVAAATPDAVATQAIPDENGEYFVDIIAPDWSPVYGSAAWSYGGRRRGGHHGGGHHHH